MNRDLLQGPSLPASFGFDEEHALLRSEARRVLAERFDVRAFYGGKETSDLYDELAALGWITTSWSWLATALLLEECGRVLLPAPIAPALLAAHALQPEELDGRRATVALAPSGGALREVPWIAEGWLVAPDESGAFFRCEIERAEVRLDRVVDRTKPTATVTVRERGRPVEIDRAALLERAWLLHAAESLGAAEAVLALTRAYAIDRQQFGRPIGTYQAVSHPLVNVMIAVENARSLVIAAAAALDHETRPAAREVACRMAKVAACEALWLAANRGVQLHGGFGFTWECDVHFYFRRALHARGTLGASEVHRRRLAALLLDHGAA